MRVELSMSARLLQNPADSTYAINDAFYAQQWMLVL
jgi:hypothetical protein